MDHKKKERRRLGLACRHLETFVLIAVLAAAVVLGSLLNGRDARNLRRAEAIGDGYRALRGRAAEIKRDLDDLDDLDGRTRGR